MAVEKNPMFWGFEAEAAISDYRIVQAGTSEGQVAQATAATNYLLGVSKPRGDGNTYAAGDSVSVYAPGSIGKVEADGSGNAIARGDALTTNASGQAIQSQNPEYDSIIGFAEEASTASGDIISFVALPQSTLNLNGAKLRAIAMATPSDGSEQDTGWDLPAKAVVQDVYVDCTTAEATGGTKTLDVGTDGSGSDDPDGFLDGVDVSATGIKKGAFASTTGSNNTYVGAAATHTRGALLTELLVEGQDTTDGGDGVAVAGEDVTSGGESVTWTPGSADWAEFEGTMYVLYVELGN